MEIQGLSHITFIVKDLDRTSRLFCDGLGAKEVYDSKVKAFSVSHEKFFLLGNVWLVAMEGTSTSRSYQHVAFKVEGHLLPHFKNRLVTLGVEIKAPRSRVDGEGESVYFYDFDNNLFELHTGTLKQRLEIYKHWPFNSAE